MRQLGSAENEKIRLVELVGWSAKTAFTPPFFSRHVGQICIYEMKWIYMMLKWIRKISYDNEYRLKITNPALRKLDGKYEISVDNNCWVPLSDEDEDFILSKDSNCFLAQITYCGIFDQYDIDWFGFADSAYDLWDSRNISASKVRTTITFRIRELRERLGVKERPRGDIYGRPLDEHYIELSLGTTARNELDRIAREYAEYVKI